MKEKLHYTLHFKVKGIPWSCRILLDPAEKFIPVWPMSCDTLKLFAESGRWKKFIANGTKMSQSISAHWDLWQYTCIYHIPVSISIETWDDISAYTYRNVGWCIFSLLSYRLGHYISKNTNKVYLVSVGCDILWYCLHFLVFNYRFIH